MVTYSAVGLISAIESDQKRFTKRRLSNNCIYNMSYDERLLKLDNERLELRRLRADLLVC